MHMPTTSKRPKRARKTSGSARRAVREAAPAPAKDAVALLKADHREVEGLFKEFKKAESGTRKQQLAQNICTALRTHTTIEEEIFYPAFLKATGAKDIHNEALVEHDGAKKLIAEIEASGPNDPLFVAKVTVLSEMIKHHVKEEEQFGGMFSKARRSKMDLRALGARMQARKATVTTTPARQAIRRARAGRAAMIQAASMKGVARGPRAGIGAHR
jgi:hemerythrin superfamily protein